MSQEIQFNQYLFSDGKLLSMTCNYEGNTLKLRLQIRKYIGKKIIPCTVSLNFEGVSELDVLDNFDTSGNYSDSVLTKLADDLYYASFDPYSNSGEPNENDNFVIRAKSCTVEEEL